MKRKFAEERTKIKVAVKGKALTVEQSKSSAKVLFPVPKIPNTEINKFKNTCGLSSRQEAKVLSIFRGWKGRDLFESNVRDKLSEEDGFLNDYHDLNTIN